MSAYMTIYVEVNLIGVIFPLLILLRNRKNDMQQTDALMYDRALVATLIILVVDTAWAFVDGRTSALCRVLNPIINVLYMTATGFITYYWLEFVLSKLGVYQVQPKWARLAAVTPLALLIVLSILSPWTGWLFVFTPGNEYARGSIHFVEQVICYGYILFSCGFAFWRASRTKDEEKRAQALMLSGFVVLPALGGLITTVVPNMPTIWPLAAVSLMIVYINLQSLQVSTDELTGLNNRRQLDRYLLSQLESPCRDEKLYLMILDVDAFKSINDTFGHVAGDQALRQTADMLKMACKGENCFIARYGGDEFVILFETTDETMPGRLTDNLDAELKRFNAENKTPYQLNMSIGMDVALPEKDTPAQLLARADEKLYEQKKRKKIKR